MTPSPATTTFPIRRPRRRRRRAAAWGLVLLALSSLVAGVSAQDVSPAMLREAARRSGLSEEEILRRYQEQRHGETGAAADTAAAPGRRSLEGIDDRVTPSRGEASYWQRPEVVLPLSGGDLTAVEAETLLMAAESPQATFFGHSFFRLPAGVFDPPSFGPVPRDYLIGVGDEIVVDAWGEVEFRIERVVDRDGTIILPRGGKVVCHNRSLEEVEEAVRERLAASYAGLKDGSIELDVSLGQLRAIRVFVIGEVTQPGAYELSSVATVLSALYAAGGPVVQGSLRRVHLQRDGEAIGTLDLYR